MAVMLAGCSHGAPRPAGAPDVPVDEAAPVVDAAVLVDATLASVDAPPAGPWDWADVRGAGGRWRRSPACDYQPPCPVWLLAARVVSVERGAGRTRVVIDLGADARVVVGMMGWLVASDGRPEGARFTVTALAARQAWAEAPGDVAIGAGRLLMWDPRVHPMPEEP